MIDLRNLLEDAVGMIHGRVCECCGRSLVRSEEVVCLQCLSLLPRANLHVTPTFNVIHERLMHRTPIHRALAWIDYTRGDHFTAIVQRAKYTGRPWILRILARIYAREIIHSGALDGIDAIIPVPMQRLKQWKRGYNQAEYVARGISGITRIPVRPLLSVSGYRSAQAHADPFLRRNNTPGSYSVRRPDELRSLRHVLVVDDVITTGATLRACVAAIHRASPGTTISVLTLAITRML